MRLHFDDAPPPVLTALLALASCTTGPAPRVDGGACVPEPIEVSCVYRDYGTFCGVPCDFDPSCHFDLHVTWSSCHLDSLSNRFVDCSCTDGIAICLSVDLPSAPRSAPTRHCEPAPVYDAGPMDFPDAATEVDASSDEPDGGE